MCTKVIHSFSYRDSGHGSSYAEEGRKEGRKTVGSLIPPGADADARTDRMCGERERASVGLIRRDVPSQAGTQNPNAAVFTFLNISRPGL